MLGRSDRDLILGECGYQVVDRFVPVPAVGIIADEPSLPGIDSGAESLDETVRSMHEFMEVHVRLPWILSHAGPSPWACGTNAAIVVQDYHHFHIVSCSVALPAAVVESSGRSIWPCRHVAYHADDLVVVPGSGELGFTGYLGVPAVPAADAVTIAVENVYLAARSHFPEPGQILAELGE
jgi:hypothetical protein